MAYVGTPTPYGTNVETLASILQGESSTVAGQTAVANVIQNRAALDYGGNGSDLLSQALAQGQFQGQTPPTAQSLTIAQQALNGSLPNLVPNSLNYAAPGSSASWAVNALNSGQGVTIGGNTFFVDDQGGTPIYNSSGLTPDQLQDAEQDQQEDGLPGPLNYGNSSTPGSGLSPISASNNSNAFGLGGPLMPDATGPGGTQAGDVTQGSGTPETASQTSPQGSAGGSTFGNIVSGIWEYVGAQATSAAGNAQAQAATQAASTTAKATTQAATTVAKGVTTAEQSAAQSGQSWVASLETAGADLFIRFGIVLLAIALLAGAWVFYAVENKRPIIPVPIPV